MSEVGEDLHLLGSGEGRERLLMTIERFKDIIQYNEPSFRYNGQEYSICSPDGKFYVLSSDNPSDVDLVFDTVDDLLTRWIIQGKPFGEILCDTNLK